MNKSILVLLAMTTLFSCAKEISPDTQDPTIMGTWILKKTKTDKTKIYIKKDSFDLYKTGYTFKEDGSCILKLKTHCGNPPIFAEVEGNYIKNNDTISIKYFLDRKNEFKLIIKSLDIDTLKVVRGF
jgi:hypothetical protein